MASILIQVIIALMLSHVANYIVLLFLKMFKFQIR